MLLPFITFDKDLLLLTISALAVGFFVAALFDWLWLKIFNIKKPKFPIRFVEASVKNNCNFSEELRERNARAIDATFPGSPAWFARKRFNSR
jgi:hypothetical protein